MKYEIMKKTVFLLALATFPATAQRSQVDLERDLRRIEGKIDQIEFDQDQRAQREEARKKLAEENRLLALPLDADLKGFLAQKYNEILADQHLSVGAMKRILRKYELGYGQVQDERNAQKK